MSDLVSVDNFRALNALLAVITFGLGCYRFPQAWKSVTSRRLFCALSPFPPVIGLGSGGAFALHVPASPVTHVITPALTACYLFLGYVLVRWPKTLTTPKGSTA